MMRQSIGHSADCDSVTRQGGCAKKGQPRDQLSLFETANENGLPDSSSVRSSNSSRSKYTSLLNRANCDFTTTATLNQKNQLILILEIFRNFQAL
jgi:hypothetical protein